MRRKFPWNGLAGRICACFLVACLASVPLCAISATTTAESGGMAKQNVAANGEFSAVSNAVVELLRSRDAAAFPSALAPSIADYQSLLPTNLPPQVQEAFKTMRANVESSAKTFLEQAVALHLDFSKGDLHLRVIPPELLKPDSPLQPKLEAAVRQLEVVFAPG